MRGELKQNAEKESVIDPMIHYHNSDRAKDREDGVMTLMTLVI